MSSNGLATKHLGYVPGSHFDKMFTSCKLFTTNIDTIVITFIESVWNLNELNPIMIFFYKIRAIDNNNLILLEGRHCLEWCLMFANFYESSQSQVIPILNLCFMYSHYFIRSYLNFRIIEYYIIVSNANSRFSLVI